MFSTSNISAFLVLALVSTASWSQKSDHECGLRENLSETPDFSHTLKAMELTGLEERLADEERYTVFVPGSKAYARFSEKQMDSIYSSKNREALRAMLEYHVIPARVDLNSIRVAVEKGDGSASYRTLNGNLLRFRMENDRIVLVSHDGSKSTLSDENYLHENGYFHVIDILVQPPGSR